MDDNSIQQKSVSYLNSYLVSILNSILESTERCPYVMKQVFHNLYNAAVQRFTDNEEVQFHVMDNLSLERDRPSETYMSHCKHR
jgi:hypothetical protein